MQISPWLKQHEQAIPLKRNVQFKSIYFCRKITKTVLTFLCRFRHQTSEQSGCGSVGSAATTDTRDLRFKSSHRQNLYWTFVYCQLHWKDKNVEKVAGNGHLKKNVSPNNVLDFCLSECGPKIGLTVFLICFICPKVPRACLSRFDASYKAKCEIFHFFPFNVPQDVCCYNELSFGNLYDSWWFV